MPCYKKKIKKLGIDKDSNHVTFLKNEIGIISVDLYNIDLDDINFNEWDPKTTIHAILMDWCNRLNNVNHLKKK